MDSDDIFKFDASLEKLAAIAVAISFWERNDVKELVKKKFSGGEHFFYESDDLQLKKPQQAIRSSGQNVINYIFEKLDSERLPEKLLHNVKYLVVMIGQKIYYWRQYVTQQLRLPEEYASVMFWTSYGEIDELKIIQEFWFRDPNFQGRECNCFLRNNLFCSASSFAQENFVHNHFEEMKNVISPYLYVTHKREKFTRYGIIATYIIFCSGKSKSKGVSAYKNFKAHPNRIPPKMLLNECLDSNLYVAARYFWSKMQENERMEVVVEAAMKCFNSHLWGSMSRNRFGYEFKSGHVYVTELRIKMLMFFLSQMTELQKVDLISKYFGSIFHLFMQVWPYQELTEKLLSVMWDHVSQKQLTILQEIFDYLTLKKKPEYFIRREFLLEILGIILERISKEAKIQFFTSDDYMHIRTLYELFDNDSLNLILNDEDLREFRAEMISTGTNYFKDIVLSGNHGCLHRFLKNMALSDEEQKLFKQKLNMLNTFLTCGELKLAEDHLNWLGYSESEQNALKNEVDALQVCYILLQKFEFEKAKNFLLWRYSTEEERKTVKEKLKADGLLQKKILDIWNSSSSDADMVLKSDELLNWFFDEFQEAVDFKRSEFSGSKFIDKYSSNLSDTFFEKLDKFLTFCLLTPEEIKITKRDIRENITFWVKIFILERNKFELINALLKWVYAKQERRKLVIKRLMNSPQGFLMCIAMFKSSPTYILKFFNDWITPNLNFPEIKIHLKMMDKTAVNNNTISCIFNFLKRREENKKVTLSQLKDYISVETFCTDRHYEDYHYDDYYEEEGDYDEDNYETPDDEENAAEDDDSDFD